MGARAERLNRYTCFSLALFLSLSMSLSLSMYIVDSFAYDFAQVTYTTDPIINSSRVQMFHYSVRLLLSPLSNLGTNSCWQY